MALRSGALALALALLAVAAAHGSKEAREESRHGQGHHKGGDHESSSRQAEDLAMGLEDVLAAGNAYVMVATAPPVPTPTLPPMPALPEPMTVAPLLAMPDPPTLAPMSWDMFDCFTGAYNWQLSWSDMQKEWCCKNKDVACETTTLRHDAFECKDDGDLDGWTDAKKVWCCKHRGFGCKHTADKSDKDESEKRSLPFDCDKARVKDWSDDKKSWCCAYTDKGCKKETKTTSKTKTTTTKTTTTSTSTTNLGCETTCKIDGKEDTCLNHIQQHSLTDFLGDADACTSAYEVILGMCSQCEVCSLHDAGCGVLEGATTTTPPPTTTTEPKGCYKTCALTGVVADCRSRVQWSAEHIYSWKPDACRKAYSLVMDQCDPCGDCVMEETGCEAVAPFGKKQELYECDDLEDASDAAKEWCCKEKQQGCSVSHKVLYRKKFDQTALRHSAVARSSGAASAFAGLGVLGFFAYLAVRARRASARASYVNVPEDVRADVPILE